MAKTKNTNTIKFGTLKVEKINSTDPLVPSEAIAIDMPSADKKALAIAINENMPALLIGETGTGKTSAIRQLAFLRQQPYVRVNMTGFTTPDELIGSKSVKDGATYYENGIITDAMARGAILVIDEINATTPDCLFILHGLLDEDRRITLPNGEIILPHKDFRVFATCNPDYEGTKSMNKAFMDRFPIILAVDVLSYKKEQKLLIDRYGIAEKLAKQLVDIATIARKDFAENKITTFVSTRSLLNVAKLTTQGLTPKEAYRTTIVRKTNQKDEQATLNDFFLAITRTSDDPTANIDTEAPIVITQGDLARYNQDIKTYQGAYEARGKQLDTLEREKLLLEKELQLLKAKKTKKSP